MDAQQGAEGAFSRRSAIKRSAGIAGAGLALAQVPLLEQLAAKPVTASASTASASATAFSDIQFDIGNFIAKAQTFNDGAGNVTAQFAPVFSLFQPLTLNRTPTTADQKVLANALNTIEEVFPASPNGALIVSVSYGLPYFNRLDQKTVKANIPTDLASGQPVLIEAVPFDTDVVGGLVGGSNALIAGVKKPRFNVNVVIEKNDVLLHTRSNVLANLTNINAWLQGSNTLAGKAVASPNFKGLFNFQTARVQFLQQGLPKKVAQENNFEFAPRMSNDSPMSMGFVDQQTDSSGPAQIVTFQGNSSAVLTSAKSGDYFDNGSIAHFSHDILDLFAFFASATQEPNTGNPPAGEPFTERVQYMFRSNQTGTTDGLPADGNSDQFTNNGGPSFINNVFQGTGAALAAAQDSAGQFSASNATLNATFTGDPRIGHEEALQQVSRASDGTPLHVRMDGPGFDNMDVPAFNTSGVANVVNDGTFDLVPNGTNVPAGSNQFKLQFIMFLPTAQLFAQMRNAAAAQKFQSEFNVAAGDNGLERFITATRRQNFLVPPRRHRSFPLVELG
jgi:hypothetical protein